MFLTTYIVKSKQECLTSFFGTLNIIFSYFYNTSGIYNIHIIRKIPRVNYFDDEEMRKLKILSTELHLCHSTRELHTRYQDSCHFFPTYVIVHEMPSARLGPLGHCIVNKVLGVLNYLLQLINGNPSSMGKSLIRCLYWIRYDPCKANMMVWTLSRSHDCTMFLLDYFMALNFIPGFQSTIS